MRATWHMIAADAKGCEDIYIYYGGKCRVRLDHEDLVELAAIEKLPAPVATGHVKIPSSVDEAVAMHFLAAAYLDVHAPHMLRRKD